MGAILMRQEIEYPTSDGQPMAETTLHRRIMSDMIEGLEHWFQDVPDVWVGGNLFLYWEEGNPRAVVAPDVLLVRGVRKWDRPVYKLWEEGRPPNLVMEITSDSTSEEDVGKKKEVYRRLGVEEYVLFDPYCDYLEPSLQGFHLRKEKYLPMRLGHDETLTLATAGLLVRREGKRLRLFNPATGRSLPWSEEQAVAREAAERRAAAETAARAREAEAREAAERRAAAETAARRAAEEGQREALEAQRAVEERSRLLEDELARLRRELERRG